MVRRVSLLAAALLLLAALSPSAAHGQSVAVPIASVGWNMVGGPPGTDLSSADALDVYNGTGYVAPASPVTTICQGYWAYFSHQVTLQLSDGPSSTSQTCTLGAGWNMVGNPFTTVATLPDGTVAYHWNPNAGSYEQTTTIPVGGSVWIYAPSATSMTLQSQPGGTSGTVVITPPFSSPYHAHVGDTVELMLSGTIGYTAHADPTYLQLIDSGTTQSSPTTQFWRWRAIAAGTTIISADPLCRESTPPCGVPSIGVQLEIAP